MKLRDQAMTIEHRLFHFPKNPFCDVCNQARMLSRRVRRKPRDPDEEPDPLEASEFGEVIAADHIHVFRSPDDSDALDKTYVLLCLRDKYTGIFAAFPGTDRSTASIVSSLRKFVGRRICSKPVTLVSDELTSSLLLLRWVGFLLLRFRIVFPTTRSLSERSERFKKVFVHHSLKLAFRFAPSFGPLLAVMILWP